MAKKLKVNGRLIEEYQVSIEEFKYDQKIKNMKE